MFYASETKRLIDKAIKGIPADKLVYIPHQAIEDTAAERLDSFDLRSKQMDIALMEWLLVGRATYCTATMISQSTFSKTAGKIQVCVDDSVYDC